MNLFLTVTKALHGSDCIDKVIRTPLAISIPYTNTWAIIIVIYQWWVTVMLWMSSCQNHSPLPLHRCPAHHRCPSWPPSPWWWYHHYAWCMVIHRSVDNIRPHCTRAIMYESYPPSSIHRDDNRSIDHAAITHILHPIMLVFIGLWQLLHWRYSHGVH